MQVIVLLLLLSLAVPKVSDALLEVT